MAAGIVLFAINTFGGAVLTEILGHGALDVRLVVTRAGYGPKSHLMPHAIADRHGLPWTTDEAGHPALEPRVAALAPEAILVGGYHRRIPRSLFETAAAGAANLHPSLLPAYRGATPVEWCIANGETETGLTLHRLEQGFDTGDILWQGRVVIGADDTAGDVLERITTSLVPAGVAAFAERVAAGNFRGVPQDPNLTSWQAKRSEGDAVLDLRWDAAKVHCRVRAMAPWPLASVMLDGMVRRVARSRLISQPPQPTLTGTLVSVAEGGERAIVACGDGRLVELIDLDPPIGNRP